MGKDNSEPEIKQGKVYKTNRYYWLKLQKNFFSSQDIMVIESQVNGEKYVLFWLKLILLAIQQEEIGILRFKPTIPYTVELLAHVLKTDIDIVRSALTLFQEFGMIKKQDNGEIWIEAVLEMVGSESESAIRVRNFRAKQELIEFEKKENQKMLQSNNDNVTM